MDVASEITGRQQQQQQQQQQKQKQQKQVPVPVAVVTEEPVAKRSKNTDDQVCVCVAEISCDGHVI